MPGRVAVGWTLPPSTLGRNQHVRQHLDRADNGGRVMSTWTTTDLHTFGDAGEIAIAPLRSDGSTRPYTTIWIVRVGDGLYVRSYHGPEGSWFRAAQGSGKGRLRADDAERDVAFEPAVTDSDTVDEAYRAKYGRSAYADAMLTPDASATTLRLIPR